VNTATLQRPWQHDAEVIGLISLAHGTSHFFHLLLPPLFPWLIGDFGLNFTQCGVLMTVFFLISGIGQALAGFVVDRVGAGPVLLFGVGALSVAGFLLGFATDYQTLVVVAAIAGAGNSIFHPADFTLLNRQVSAPRLGHAFSSHGLVGNLGWAGGAAFMGAVAAIAGWHAAGFGAGGLALAVFLVLALRRHRLLTDPQRAPADRPRHAQRRDGAFGFLKSSAVWMCFVFFFLSTGAFAVLQNFAPALLGHVFGASAVVATAALTAYLLGSTAGMLLGGFVAGRSQHNDTTIALALGLSAALAVWLALGAVPSWSLTGLLAMMGFGVGVAGPSRDLLVRRAATAGFGASSYGRIYGFVYSGLDAGMALPPVVFGRLFDAGLFRSGLMGIAVLQVGALLTAVAVGRVALAHRRAGP
jgi:MFS family permease